MDQPILIKALLKTCEIEMGDQGLLGLNFNHDDLTAKHVCFGAQDLLMLMGSKF